MNIGVYPGIGAGIDRPVAPVNTRLVLMLQDYTFVLDDMGGMVGIWDTFNTFNYPSVTYTIPKDVFPQYAVLQAFYSTRGLGETSTITIAAANGVTIRKPGTTITGNRTLNSRATCTMIQMDPNEWWVDGPGVT